MFGSDSIGKPLRIAFVLVPEFTMIAFSACVEPFRIANRVSGKNLYRCQAISLDGRPVLASNGLSVNVDGGLDDIAAETVFVCGGIDIKDHVDDRLLKKLRRLSSHGVNIGSVDTATHILAAAGLLNGHKCTIHWENIPSFIVQFPDIEVTSELFEIDRGRYTCSGGIAALDLALRLISKQYDPATAAAVADQVMHHRIREGHERQRMGLRSRLGVAHPKLLAVIGRMEESLEEPLSCCDLAREVGLSARQLERLFRKYLATAPTKYYLDLRLNKARFLLRQTSLPILSIALACGFVSASHFSKCYREHFERTPSEERRVAV